MRHALLAGALTCVCSGAWPHLAGVLLTRPASALRPRCRLARAARPGLKGAIALSQAVIAGGAVAGVAVALRRAHPSDPSKLRSSTVMHEG